MCNMVFVTCLVLFGFGTHFVNNFTKDRQALRVQHIRPPCMFWLLRNPSDQLLVALCRRTRKIQSELMRNGLLANVAGRCLEDHTLSYESRPLAREATPIQENLGLG